MSLDSMIFDSKLQKEINRKNMATTDVDIVETAMSAQQLGTQLSEHRDPFAPSKTVRLDDVNERVEWWRNHYKALYKMNPDFSTLYIPERPKDFDRLIIIPKGLSHQKWVVTARTIHEVYLYNDDLDGVITVNDRTPKDRSYGIWIRDRQEADVELKGKSAEMLASEVINGITLLERLVAGTGYLFEKMCHMDQENVTLCTGSRDSGGDVPRVYWGVGGRKVYVDYGHPSHSDPSLRSRAVVS